MVDCSKIKVNQMRRMDDVLLELLQLLMMGIIVLLLMTVCFWLWIKKLRKAKAGCSSYGCDDACYGRY